MFTGPLAEHRYKTADIHPFLEQFTVDTIIGDISEHMSRNVNYMDVCQRIFKNTLGSVDAYDIWYRHTYHNDVPVPYYGQGTYEEVLNDYYENVVEVQYRPLNSNHAKLVIRFTTDDQKLHDAEVIYKSMVPEFDVELTTEHSD